MSIISSGAPAVKPVTLPRIYSRRKGAETPPPDAVYVGRPSAWSNPFVMRSEIDRHFVCSRFEVYALDRLKSEPGWLEPLRGKDLVCWCYPKRCHAETLIRLANAAGEGAAK